MRTFARDRIAQSGTLLVWVALLLVPAVRAQSISPPDPNSVPVIDGGIGRCSADFKVIDNAGAPIYAAMIQVHIAYGFLSAYKLDLEVGTNASGKARFTGLPAKTKHGLFFRASKGPREGSAFDDTAKTCKAEFTIELEEKKPAAKLEAGSGICSVGSEVVDRRIALSSTSSGVCVRLRL
jgi:hypothetical protein